MSSHEKEIYPTTTFDENCIEFEFQIDRNYYVDLKQKYVAGKLKVVKGRDYETYNSKTVKKEHKDEAKADEDSVSGKEEQEAPIPLGLHLKSILHSIFSSVDVYINNQQIYNSNDLYAQKSYNSNN